MKRANAFVNVSTYEGRPNTVLEALAARCPVIVSDIEAHHECLGDGAGLYVPPTEPDRIGAAILATVDGGDDVASRVAKGRGIAEGHTIKACGDHWLRVLNSVCESN